MGTKSEKKSEEQQTQPAAAITMTAQPAPTGAALASSSHDEIAAALDGVDVGDGGLGEVDNSDIKVPAKVWNFKGVDAAGDPIPPNVFYDTVQERTDKALEVVFLDLHKTKEWREYDEAEGKSKVRCRSASGSENADGTMEDGTVRPCKGCPDAQWRNVQLPNGKTKRTRNCGPVYNVIAAEQPSGEPCVMRFKRTSLPVIQAHLNKNHIGKLLIGGGRRGNVPFYSLSARVSLKMSEDKKYSIPVIEVTRKLPNAEVVVHAESSRFWREHVLPMLDKIADKDQDGGADGGVDTSFNPAEFGGDDGPGSRGAQNGDRFADDRAR